jgi:quercetin dioxygenase-like cupin family protein
MKKLTLEPLPLTAMADYQEGSIVSRTIINKKTTTVTLFAFDAGQGLSEHTAPFDAFIFILDGEAELTVAGNPVNISEGEMLIMPANQPHSLKALKRFKMLLTMVRE